MSHESFGNILPCPFSKQWLLRAFQWNIDYLMSNYSKEKILIYIYIKRSIYLTIWLLEYQRRIGLCLGRVHHSKACSTRSILCFVSEVAELTITRQITVNLSACLHKQWGCNVCEGLWNYKTINLHLSKTEILKDIFYNENKPEKNTVVFFSTHVYWIYLLLFCFLWHYVVVTFGHCLVGNQEPICLQLSNWFLMTKF